MSGALLFAQLALAVHRTNLERVVVDITVAPAFSIGKDKLETWREWAETVSCACRYFHSLFSFRRLESALSLSLPCLGKY